MNERILDASAILRARAARYAQITAAEAAATHEVVRFRRGDDEYAVAHGSLREIRPLRRFCRILGASPVVPGVFHYRGEIISLHDLRALGQAGASPAFAAWVLVAESGAVRIGLLADEVVGIEALADEDIKPLPLTMGAKAGVLRGVAHGDLLLIDAPALFTSPEFFYAFSPAAL